MTTARMAARPVLIQDKPKDIRIGPLLLLLFGLVLVYPITIRPLLRTFQAQSWVATPCKVLQGEVRSRNTRFIGITYDVHITYEYQFAGEAYQSDTYDFVSDPATQHDGKARIVETYKTMADPVCYVNPRNPSQAVLARGFNPKLMLAFVPLLLILIGVGGAFGMIPDRERRPGYSTSVLRMTEKGSIILEPNRLPLLKLVGAIVIGAFWNAMAFIFAVVMIRGFRSNSTGWYLVFFLLPFTFLGMIIVISVIRQFMALSNPRPRLELSSPTVPLGGTAKLWWIMPGRVDRIEEFTVILRGIEEVARADGVRSKGRRSIDRSTFHEAQLCRTSKADEIAAGGVELTLPRETMYSFATLHSRIFWTVDVDARIAKWPDVRESMKVSVVPAPLEQGPVTG